MKRCFLDRERPIFGDYTIRCVWDGQMKQVHVYRLGTTKKPSLDIISGYIVARMAKRVAAQETARAASAART
jgi:hypothetical protein